MAHWWLFPIWEVEWHRELSDCCYYSNVCLHSAAAAAQVGFRRSGPIWTQSYFTFWVKQPLFLQQTAVLAKVNAPLLCCHPVIRLLSSSTTGPHTENNFYPLQEVCSRDAKERCFSKSNINLKVRRLNKPHRTNAMGLMVDSELIFHDTGWYIQCIYISTLCS